MGDRIYLNFFVNQDQTFNKDTVLMWFEDIEGTTINIGDVYTYFTDSDNKPFIKEDLKEHFNNEKGLYKEIKELLAVMKEYEQTSF